MPGAQQVFGLASEFHAASIAVWNLAVNEMEEVGEEHAEQWRDNALALADGGLIPGSSGIGTRRARGHARAITSERKLSFGSTIRVETGPDASRRYGTMGMGFEYGSENSPAQLNGLRALPAAEKRMARMAGNVFRVLPQ